MRLAALLHLLTSVVRFVCFAIELQEESSIGVAAVPFLAVFGSIASFAIDSLALLRSRMTHG